MARAQYADTIMFIDTVTGALKPANNARVTVYQAGTTTAITIYTTRSAGTTKSNPFTTDSTGAAEFWADWGDWDIKIEDLNVPSRFGTKTIGWQATTGVAGAIPYASLDAMTTRQFAAIGTVFDWWRPNNTVSIPTGFAICDGSVVTSGNHDFGTGASITLPDLRNVFVVGANSGNTDGQAGTGTDTAAGAPGIAGAGGSNVHTLTTAQIPSHTHTIDALPAHTHTLSVSGTTSSNGAHTHTVTLPTGIDDEMVVGGSLLSHFHFNVTTTTSSSGAHTHTVTSTGTSGSNGAYTHTIGTAGSGASHNNMPRYVGLLKIMKIKRS